MPEYRIEVSPNNRAVCTDTVCKRNADKITKGSLRFGSYVEIPGAGRGSFKWKHWGCVSGAQLVHVQGLCLRNDQLRLDYFDGYDEISDVGLQQKIRRCVEQGHIDPEDFNGDPEYNVSGQRGIRGRSTVQAATEERHEEKVEEEAEKKKEEEREEKHEKEEKKKKKKKEKGDEKEKEDKKENKKRSKKDDDRVETDEETKEKVKKDKEHNTSNRKTKDSSDGKSKKEKPSKEKSSKEKPSKEKPSKEKPTEEKSHIETPKEKKSKKMEPRLKKESEDSHEDATPKTKQRKHAIVDEGETKPVKAAKQKKTDHAPSGRRLRSHREA